MGELNSKPTQTIEKTLTKRTDVIHNPDQTDSRDNRQAANDLLSSLFKGPVDIGTDVYPNEPEEKYEITPFIQTEKNPQVDQDLGAIQQATQPEVVEGVVVEDDESVTQKIESILANPRNFTRIDVEDALLDALRGRTYEQFLQQETSPELVDVVNQLVSLVEQSLQRNRENLLRTADALNLPQPTETAEINAEDLNTIGIVDLPPEEAGQDGEKALEVSVKDKDGSEKKYKIGMAAAVVFFLVGDMALFGGRNLEAIGERLGSELGTFALLKLGFDVKFSNSMEHSASTTMLGMIDTPKLTQYLEDSQSHEVYTFLNQLDVQTRRAMLSGESFGGALHNKHKFTAEEIAMVFKKLHNDELVRLEIKDLQPQAANTQTAQPTPAPAPVGATSG